MRTLGTVLQSIVTAFRYPRVWILAWLLVTVPALLVLFPIYEVMSSELSQHPGVGFLLDQSLDSDLVRNHPELRISLIGAGLFVLLAWVFLAGGVLSTVGRVDRFSFTIFLSDGARLFLRNLRVLCIGLIPVALLFWGTDALREWLAEGPLRDTDPGSTFLPLWLFDIRWVHVLESLLYFSGFVFMLVLFLSKVAMAHLAVGDRRSALLAWLVAIGRFLRHPLRASLLVFWLSMAFLLLPSLIGLTTAWALEVGQNLWLGLLLGQCGVISSQLVLLAFLLSARRFLLGAEDMAGADSEPAVEMPSTMASTTEKSRSRVTA